MNRILLISLALAVTPFTFANAAIPAADGTIKACYKKKSGKMRVIDERKRCKRSERTLSFSATGAAGQNGRDGRDGADGANGTNGANGANGTNGAAGPSHVTGSDPLPGAVIHGFNTGSGGGIYGRTGSTDDEAYGVQGEIASATPGGYSAGVRGINNGTGGDGIGVWGSHAGTGWGVYGQSVGSVGVYGQTGNGIGVYGTATQAPFIAGRFDGDLLLANGGAPRGFAFRHVVNTSSNTCEGGDFTIIDHPAANGNPSADLLVTRNAGSSGVPVGTAFSVFYDDGSLLSCDQGHWLIFAESGAALANGTTFNVMVDKP